MSINDGQSHLLRNGTTLTLNNPDKSNQPTQSTANKPNEPTKKELININEQGNNLNTKNTGNNISEETNNLNTQMQKQMQMMQQMIDGQKEAKESLEALEKIQQDIQNIRHTNNEIRENINLATAKADEALMKSIEATEQATEARLMRTLPSGLCCSKRQKESYDKDRGRVLIYKQQYLLKYLTQVNTTVSWTD